MSHRCYVDGCETVVGTSNCAWCKFAYCERHSGILENILENVYVICEDCLSDMAQADTDDEEWDDMSYWEDIFPTGCVLDAFY